MAQNVKCPRCGRITPDSTYCQYCGKALHACAACGARISTRALYCPECGGPISKEQREAISVERTSWAWWLLPLFLGWVGGLISWALIRYRDPNKATYMLWFGISFSVILTIVGIVVRATQH